MNLTKVAAEHDALSKVPESSNIAHVCHYHLHQQLREAAYNVRRIEDAQQQNCRQPRAPREARVVCIHQKAADCPLEKAPGTNGVNLHDTYVACKSHIRVTFETTFETTDKDL